jgi:hypothetical protein
MEGIPMEPSQELTMMMMGREEEEERMRMVK